MEHFHTASVVIWSAGRHSVPEPIPSCAQCRTFLSTSFYSVNSADLFCKSADGSATTLKRQVHAAIFTCTGAKPIDSPLGSNPSVHDLNVVVAILAHSAHGYYRVLPVLAHVDTEPEWRFR